MHEYSFFFFFCVATTKVARKYNIDPTDMELTPAQAMSKMPMYIKETTTNIYALEVPQPESKT